MVQDLVHKQYYTGNRVPNHMCRGHVSFPGNYLFLSPKSFPKETKNCMFFLSIVSIATSGEWPGLKKKLLLLWRTHFSIFSQRTSENVGGRCFPIFAQTCKTNTTRPCTQPQKTASPPNRNLFLLSHHVTWEDFMQLLLMPPAAAHPWCIWKHLNWGTISIPCPRTFLKMFFEPGGKQNLQSFHANDNISNHLNMAPFLNPKSILPLCRLHFLLTSHNFHNWGFPGLAFPYAYALFVGNFLGSPISVQKKLCSSCRIPYTSSKKPPEKHTDQTPPFTSGGIRLDV